MKNIKFLKEPGYIHDLCYLFLVYFNRQMWIEQWDAPDKRAKASERFDKLLDGYLPMSDELLLFFYQQDGYRCLMSEQYFAPFVKEFVTEKFNLSVILEALSDYNRVVENVIRFYFRNITEEEVAECKSSLRTVNRLIRESKYGSEVKSALYSFFIEPLPIIQKLIYELTAKEIILSQQYQREYDKILKAQETFVYTGFAEKLLKIKSQPVDIKDADNIYISFCLFKDSIHWRFYDESVVFFMGIDYMTALERLITHRESPELNVFGNAVSEKNRVEILNLIVEKGEVTVRDVEKTISTTSTNAYYHLMLMVKAGILKSRNQGRTVLYRIDQNYFESLIAVLEKYKSSGTSD